MISARHLGFLISAFIFASEKSKVPPYDVSLRFRYDLGERIGRFVSDWWFLAHLIHR